MRSRTALPSVSGSLKTAPAPGAWARLPVVWLGAGILMASIIGCATMIVLAWRYPDAPVPTSGAQAMKVPVERGAAATSPPPEPRR